MLVDHADPGGEGRMRRARRQRPERARGVRDLDPPVVRDVVPEQDVHQRGLAGTVLAEQGHDLAPPQLEVDGIVGHELAEALRDALQPQNWRRRAHGRKLRDRRSLLVRSGA